MRRQTTHFLQLPLGTQTALAITRAVDFAKIFTKGLCNSYRAAILPPSFPSLFTHAPERFSSCFNQASDTCQQHQNAFYSLLQLQSQHCVFIEGLTLTADAIMTGANFGKGEELRLC